jgi:pimeloyl-ACP methyl ester carboxylesterase
MSVVNVDGHEIDYEVRGDGAPELPTLLFLHGLATDRRVLVDALDGAAERFRRIYVDLPGHGGSRADVARVSTDDHAAVVATLVNTLAPKSLAVVGYAFGGYLAQVLPTLRDGIRGLFLICPTVEADFGKRTVPARRVVGREELTFSDDPREKLAFEEVAVVQSRAALEAFQRLIHPANIVADQDVLAATRARYVFSRPYTGALGTVEGPVSIVCGRDDHWVGWQDASRLLNTVPNAELTVVANAGHLLPLEQTARLREIFSRWLAGL